MTGMDKAVEAAGGQSHLARALGVKRQSVQQWVSRGWPPNGRIVEIANLYGVDRMELLDPATASLIADSDAFDA